MNIMKRIALAAMVYLACVCISGCYGTNRNPTHPPVNISESTTDSAANNGHILWGLWNVEFDINNLNALLLPSRGPETHYNITGMLLPPECGNCVEFEVNSFNPVTRILDVDVTLRNPTQVTAYDVRGILNTNDYGHLLTNADDWTDLWDVPGGEILNPFKAFAKEEMHRIFAGDSQHTENYLVYIPSPPQYAAITFTVDASWPGNCNEPYAISGPIFPYHDVLYTEEGSKLYFTLEVLDWQEDVNTVMISAPGISPSQSIPFEQIDSEKWGVEITNDTGASPGEYHAIIKATSANSGNLALYDVITISVRSGWARTWGGADYDIVYAVAEDGSGNIYATGCFAGTADFDPGPGIDNQDSNGGLDIFLCKLDSSGNSLWTRTWGASSSLSCDRGRDIDVDGYGNIFVTGYFNGTVDFNPGPGIEEHTSYDQFDAFLSKFNSSGDFQWARTWGGYKWDKGSGVAVDGYGNIYVTGFFEYEVDFDPGPDIDSNLCNGGWDAFLSKFDASGNHQWVRTWGGSDFDNSESITVDGYGNICVTGYYQGTVDFDPGPGVEEHISSDYSDIFLSKFDSSGNLTWAQTWGGSESQAGFGVAVDGYSNIYVTGKFRETVDFDPGPEVDIHVSNGEEDIFLNKFDPSGIFQWALTWGESGVDLALDVAVDGYGKIYVTGRFSETVDFDPGPGIDEHTWHGTDDIFLSKFNQAGNFEWARSWGGSGYWGEHGRSVAVDGSGDIYVAGRFNETVDFDPGEGIDMHTSNGGSGACISKFPPDGNWQ